MAKLPNKTILKTLIRQVQRLEKIKKGHTFQYAPGEIEHLIKCLNQIKNEYKDLDYFGKPIGLPMPLFEKLNSAGPDLFQPES